jgi:hypothetical protein
MFVHVWCVVHLYFLIVLNVWSLYLDNKQSVVPECVAEDLPEQQPGEGKCHLTHYVPFILNSLSRITLLKPKDWLVCIYLILVYLSRLSWLALWYCFNLINKHDVITYDTMMLSRWYYRDTQGGLGQFSWVPPRKDLFVEWPPGITVQPWGWNGTPLAE